MAGATFSRYLSSLGVAVDGAAQASVARPGARAAVADSRTGLPQPTLTHIGRYELKSVVCESGLGRVYQAWDALGRRSVAIKTLHFDLPLQDRVTLDRALLKTVRAATQLQHRHIVPVLEAGLCAHGIFLATGFLPGRDLRQALALGWAPSPGQGARMVRRVADVLAWAAQRGVVHGDLKPSNVMLDGEGRPAVLDFGLARTVRQSRLVLLPEPPAGAMPCTAPEVVAGQLPDGRSDVYALGLMLYELLSGWQAFAPGTRQEIVQAIRAGTPIAAHRLRAAVPLHLSDLAERAMSPDPEARPRDAARFAQELRSESPLQPPFSHTQPAEMVETPHRRWSPGPLGRGA